MTLNCCKFKFSRNFFTSWHVWEATTAKRMKIDPLSTSRPRYDHVTDALAILHWLRVPERVNFKLALMAYRVLNGIWRRRTSINLFRYPALLVVAIYGRLSHCSCSSRHTVCQQSAVARFRLQPLRSGTPCQMTFSLHNHFLPSVDF